MPHWTFHHRVTQQLPKRNSWFSLASSKIRARHILSSALNLLPTQSTNTSMDTLPSQHYQIICIHKLKHNILYYFQIVQTTTFSTQEDPQHLTCPSNQVGHQAGLMSDLSTFTSIQKLKLSSLNIHEGLGSCTPPGVKTTLILLYKRLSPFFPFFL